MPDSLDDFFMRRFSRAREAGDMAEALEIWKQLVTRNFDRIRIHVRAFQFPGGQRMPVDHRDDATQDAYLRVLSMGAKFRGTCGPEFRAGLKRAVWFACMDYGRDLKEYEEPIAGSIDERYEHADAGRFDNAIERYLSAREQEATDIADSIAYILRERQLCEWAISQVANANYREILILTLLEGLAGNEIAERLAIHRDTVYKRRERALKKLEEVLRGHRP